VSNARKIIKWLLILGWLVFVIISAYDLYQVVQTFEQTVNAEMGLISPLVRLAAAILVALIWFGVRKGQKRRQGYGGNASFSQGYPTTAPNTTIETKTIGKVKPVDKTKTIDVPYYMMVYTVSNRTSPPYDSDLDTIYYSDPKNLKENLADRSDGNWFMSFGIAVGTVRDFKDGKFIITKDHETVRHIEHVVYKDDKIKQWVIGRR